MIEQPYYVINKGWCSFNPSRTHAKYGLVCQQLLVGDTCISLSKRNNVPTKPEEASPSKPTTPQSKTSKRKELEKHLNLLNTKNQEINERKRRRWSAPDQINEKTAKKVAKTAKLANGEKREETVVATTANGVALQNGSNLQGGNVQNGGAQNGVNGGESIHSSPTQNYHPSSLPNSYYPYSTSNSSFTSHIYVSNPSTTHAVNPLPAHPINPSVTQPTHLLTKPIVSHLPLSTSHPLSSSHLPLSTSSGPVNSGPSNFSISTLSAPSQPKHDVHPYSKPYLLPPHAGSPPNFPPNASSNFAPNSNFASDSSFASTTSFLSSQISSDSYPRGSYTPPSNGGKFTPPVGTKNNFGNVGTLAKSANTNPTTSGGAVDFSKYAVQK